MNASFLERIPMALDMYRQAGLIDMLLMNAQYLLYNSSALILLIFIGTLFTKRHGFFTIFILVGYYLPAMLVGLPTEVQNDPTQLLLISLAVMVYRSLLSLIAPIWMSRTTLLKGKQRLSGEYRIGPDCAICHAVLSDVLPVSGNFRFDPWQFSVF
jgi:hypothetical protein